MVLWPTVDFQVDKCVIKYKLLNKTFFNQMQEIIFIRIIKLQNKYTQNQKIYETFLNCSLLWSGHNYSIAEIDLFTSRNITMVANF